MLHTLTIPTCLIKVCAILCGGGYAEKVAVPEKQVLRRPTNVSLFTAASLPHAACTVWSELFMQSALSALFWLPKDRARLCVGEKLLVTCKPTLVL